MSEITLCKKVEQVWRNCKKAIKRTPNRKPLIRSIDGPIKHWENTPWPLQTNNVMECLDLIAKQEERSLRKSSSKEERDIYKDIVEGLEPIKVGLQEKKQQRQNEVVLLQEKED